MAANVIWRRKVALRTDQDIGTADEN